MKKIKLLEPDIWFYILVCAVALIVILGILLSINII